jgi:hypothetical protein
MSSSKGKGNGKSPHNGDKAEPGPAPFSLSYPAHLTARQRRAIYETQVHGFIEASELVDVDEAVLTDILDNFEGYDDEDPPLLDDEDSSDLEAYINPCETIRSSPPFFLQVS